MVYATFLKDCIQDIYHMYNVYIIYVSFISQLLLLYK